MAQDGALKIEDVPTSADKVMVLADFYRDTAASSDVAGSTCVDGVSLKPGERAKVRLVVRSAD